MKLADIPSDSGSSTQGISPVVVRDGSDVPLHVPDLVSSAFFYNQMLRHITSILVLIGARDVQAGRSED